MVLVNAIKEIHIYIYIYAKLDFNVVLASSGFTIGIIIITTIMSIDTEENDL